MQKSLCIVVRQCFKKDLIQLELYIKLLPRVHFRKHVSHNQSKSVVLIVLLHGTFCLSSSSLSNLFSRASLVFLFLLRDEVHGNWKGCCGLSLGEGVCREGKDGVGDDGICNVTGNWEMGGGDGAGEEQFELRLLSLVFQNSLLKVVKKMKMFHVTLWPWRCLFLVSDLLWSSCYLPPKKCNM